MKLAFKGILLLILQHCCQEASTQAPTPTQGNSRIRGEATQSIANNQVETAISAPEVAARVDRKSGSQNPPGHGFVRKLLVGELVDSWRPRNGLEDLSTSHRKDALKSHRRVRRRRSRRTAAINDYLKTYEDHFRKVETLEGVLSGPGSTSESMYLRIYKATEPDDS